MPVTGIDPEKCQKRNAYAARKGVEAVPMKFLRPSATVGQGSTSALGTLPQTDEDALARINALRDPSAEPLTLEDVYIHYAEAANSSFIPDRYGFLSRKTLKNIATDASAGFAFMNSHRTGGMSHPSELPYGKTFAGRYEKADDGSERTMIGFYMLRGQYPNGPNGPSTDSMHAGITGGTLFDVSVGLYGGEALCDICGNCVDDWDECPHVPGTDYGMSADQMQAQKDRGVPDGCATYTLDDSHCGETSAVFDGAVPGAGFRKALLAERKGKLTGPALAQAHRAFAPLYQKGSEMDGSLTHTIQEALTSVLTAFGLKPKHTAARLEAGDRDDETTDTQEPQEEAEVPENPNPNSADATLPALEPRNTLAGVAGPLHPILATAFANGIDTPEKLTETLADAANGRAFLSAERDRAKKLAVVAFGNEEAVQTLVESAHAALDASSLSVVQGLARQYEALAKRQGFMAEDGKPKERRSAPADLPQFANDVQPMREEKEPTVETPGTIYTRMNAKNAAQRR